MSKRQRYLFPSGTRQAHQSLVCTYIYPPFRMPRETWAHIFWCTPADFNYNYVSKNRSRKFTYFV